MKWVGLLTHWKINLFETINVCLSYFIFYFSVHYSSALLCIMSLEKFFAVYFPLRSRRICTVKTAKWVSGIAALIYAGFEFLLLILKKEDRNKGCLLSRVPEHYKMIHSRIDAVLYSFGPFTVMVLANTAIIFKLLAAKLRSKRNGTESTNQALSKSAVKGTTMLITVSMMFIILTAPVAISVSVWKEIPRLLYAIMETMRYTNHSINGVLYCASGSRFRAELLKTFPFKRCIKHNVNNLSLSNSSSNVSVTNASGAIPTTSRY